MSSLIDDLVRSGVVPRPTGPPVAFDAWTNVVQHDLLRFRFDCARPSAFRGTVTKRALARLSLIAMESERHAAYREHDTIAPAERGYYLMTLQLSGQFQMEQNGRRALLKPGSFALYDSSQPATMTASNDYQSLCITFPKSCVGADSENALDEVTVVPFDCEQGLASTVWALALSLQRDRQPVGSHSALADRTILELVTAMLRTDLGQRQLAGTERRATLVQQVREAIDARLDEPHLAPPEIAAKHYISTRYLHKLFADTGWTVTAWIRARRLEHCRRDLTDPRLLHVPVSTIGKRWGFASASHFGQVFKQATGQTPTEFRHETWPRQQPQ